MPAPGPLALKLAHETSIKGVGRIYNCLHTDQVLHHHLLATAGSMAMDQPSLFSDLPPVVEKLGGGGGGGGAGLGKHPLEGSRDDWQTSEKGIKQKKFSPRK